VVVNYVCWWILNTPYMHCVEVFPTFREGLVVINEGEVSLFSVGVEYFFDL